MRTLLRWFRRLLALVVTLILLAAAAIAGVIWVTLPGGDMTAAIPGLAAPVAIAIDSDDIPHVRAASEADAAAALGFLHARSRMFQMDLMRRAAGGELAELFGPAALAYDKRMRVLGLRARAVADLAVMPADTRGLIDAYARGVNAWIRLRGRLAAPEFAVYGAPRPWTPVDSLLWGKSMAIYLSGNWHAELARLLLDAKLPAKQVDELWPPAPGAGHPEAALAPSPALARTATRLADAFPDFPAPFTLPHEASNGWAVDGAHSATGAPLLAGDPHLGYGFPSLWYLARLDWPGGTLAGATAPGVPFVVIGHNGHIAWTFTTTGADTEDLFVETPVDASHYQTPNGPLPYTLREERIRVRGAPDVTLLVRETLHGPVISDVVDPKGPQLALAAAWLAPGDTAAAGLLALDRAEGVAAAGHAAGLITSPVQNLTVADHEKIALFVTGRVPVRRAGDGARPVPGASGAFDWTGFASGEQLPHIVAPATGHLLNANERIAPPDFPVFLGRDWYDDLRAQRIRQLLTAGEKHSVADFAAMQTDVVDLAARALLPRLRGVAAPEDPAKAALALLQGWDGAAVQDAPEPLIFNAWMQQFYAMLLARIGVPEQGRAAVAPWPQLVPYVLSPAGAHFCGGNCDKLLADSLSAAATELARRFGSNPASWRWGAAHIAHFDHPVLSRLPLIGRLTAIATPAPGDDLTIDRGGVGESLDDIHGPEYRGVYDLADLDRSLFVMAPGQSGNPFSRDARNFLQRWRDGASVMLPSQAARAATHITLSP